MKRFLILNFTDSFNLLVETMIKEKGYLQVENPYTDMDNDNDVIIIDTLDECWCYGDNGSTLLSNHFLSKFENVNKLSGGDYISLQNIIRYASKSDDYSDDIYLRNKSGEDRD